MPRTREQAAAHMRKWRAANKERHAATRAANYRANKAHFALAKRRRKYGVTPEMLVAMLVHQRHQCPVCRNPLMTTGTLLTPSNELTRRICVDHDHDTGEVRGLLCHRCNTSEGWVRRHLTSLQAYLANPPARTLLALA